MLGREPGKKNFFFKF